MNAWNPELSFLTLFVNDVKVSKEFYLRVFAASIMFEDENSCVFTFANLGINLLNRTQAPELVEPLTVAAPDSGATCLLSVPVDDVDAMVTDLSERGVTWLNGPIDRPWGIRTASFADPDGHVWELTQ